jgi:hypothetical protein
MGYRGLTPQTMVNVSGPWLDPEQVRPVFTALPLLAALLPILEEAHEGLLSTQRRGSTLQQQIKALVDKGVELDALHDRKMRGAYNYLGALDDMTDDPAFAASVRNLRDRLVPAGLKATIRSYTDQAGDAKMLPSRLDEASTRVLKKLKTPEGPLSDVVDAWIATALELEKVDAQRIELEKLVKAGAGGITARDVVNARNAWIRAVRAVETNLELEKGATDEIVERILGRLRREETKAERRARKGGAGSDAAGADDETEDETEDDSGAETLTDNAPPNVDP